MAREILGGFGPERSIQGSRASSGGITQQQGNIPNYSPAKGPTNINDSQSPGLHGDNCGNCGTQGSYGTNAQSSGSPGLGGTNRGMGTNRKG